jgi:hypothetical protein
VTPATKVLRAVVGLAFVAAGAGKLLGPGKTRIAPVLLGTASGTLATAAAVVEDGLPWLEVLAGCAAWVGAGRAVRCLLGLGLAALFVLVAFALPDGVRCGCFGVLGELDGRAAHLGVAGTLGALVLALFWSEHKAL